MDGVNEHNFDKKAFIEMDTYLTTMLAKALSLNGKYCCIERIFKLQITYIHLSLSL